MEKKKIDLFKGLMDAEIERIEAAGRLMWDDALYFMEHQEYDPFLEKVTKYVANQKSANYLRSLKQEVLDIVEPAPAPVPEPAHTPTTIEKIVSEINKLAGETTINNQ
jgi:hypothetical protein